MNNFNTQKTDNPHINLFGGIKKAKRKFRTNKRLPNAPLTPSRRENRNPSATF